MIQENSSIQPHDSLSQNKEVRQCTQHLLPVNDSLELTAGKWRLHLVMALMYLGPLRFNQLQRELPGISSKVLSGELKALEVNDIVERKTHDTDPVTVEYSLTPYGTTLEPVVRALREWGLTHRKRMMKP